jgi:hypothetical protein
MWRRRCRSQLIYMEVIMSKLLRETNLTDVALISEPILSFRSSNNLSLSPPLHMSITTYYQHGLGRAALKYVILPHWQHRAARPLRREV